MGALLHEGPVQTLSGIWLLANALREDLVRSGVSHADDARQIERLAKEAGVELKTLLKEFLMIPVPLDDGEGFLLGLEYLADQVATEGLARCTTRLPPAIEFRDAAVPRHLFKIAQEAIRNATRHSKATRLKVRLSETRRAIVLTIEDDGIGFTPKPKSSSGLGLQIMNYRARAIGATLEISQLRVRGTAVVCTLEK